MNKIMILLLIGKGEQMQLARNVHGRYLVRQEGSLQLQPKMIDCYLTNLQECGRMLGTISSYRHYLGQLYAFLPDNKEIQPDTLLHWRQSLAVQGYTARTINAHLSAANGLLRYFDRQDLQLDSRLQTEKVVQPELTRAEYQRLLQAARHSGKERLYLLIKLFGTTGLPLGDIPAVTVEAVRAGVIPVGRKGETICLPTCLRKELLDYTRRQGVRSGQLFLTRSGKPVGRSSVTDAIRHLCKEAQVPAEKGSPRCLRNMYHETRARLEREISVMIEQAYDQLAEDELAWVNI